MQKSSSGCAHWLSPFAFPEWKGTLGVRGHVVHPLPLSPAQESCLYHCNHPLDNCQNTRSFPTTTVDVSRRYLSYTVLKFACL